VSDGRGPLLQVENLDVSFATTRGQLRAVQDVSLTLHHGKTLGIVGESGSGKTVLSRAIMGLLPMASTTQTGSVRYDGAEILNAPAAELRKLWSTHIAMVFQDPMTSLNPVQRIGNQISEPLRIHLKLSKSEAKETALSLLMQVGIPSPVERYEAYPAQLSGGMRQRVMIAIALACAPRLLMADEPTTGLDVTVQAQILDLLGKLQHDREMAMILVTHDLGVVATRTDDIIVMYAGNVVERAPTNVLFKSMAMPYTEALLDSTPRLTNPSHTRLTAIEGRPPDLLNPPAGCPFSPRCPYAQEKCHNEKPPLVEAEPGHSYACWYPLPAGNGRSPGPINIPGSTGDAAIDVDTPAAAGSTVNSADSKAATVTASGTSGNTSSDTAPREATA
jgi:oligopeptide/dipeptide ABC transporter ATP-binding protein